MYTYRSQTFMYAHADHTHFYLQAQITHVHALYRDRHTAAVACMHVSGSDVHIYITNLFPKDMHTCPFLGTP